MARHPHPHRRQRGGTDNEEHLPRCGRQRQERGGKDGHPRRVRSHLRGYLHGLEQGLVRRSCAGQPRRWFHDRRSGSSASRRGHQVAVWPIHHQLGSGRDWVARGANDRGADFTGCGHRNGRDPLHPHADDEQNRQRRRGCGQRSGRDLWAGRPKQPLAAHHRHRRCGENSVAAHGGQPLHRHRYRCVCLLQQRCGQCVDQPTPSLHAHHR